MDGVGRGQRPAGRDRPGVTRPRQRRRVAGAVVIVGCGVNGSDCACCCCCCRMAACRASRARPLRSQPAALLGALRPQPLPGGGLVRLRTLRLGRCRLADGCGRIAERRDLRRFGHGLRRMADATHRLRSAAGVGFGRGGRRVLLDRSDLDLLGRSRRLGLDRRSLHRRVPALPWRRLPASPLPAASGHRSSARPVARSRPAAPAPPRAPAREEARPSRRAADCPAPSRRRWVQRAASPASRPAARICWAKTGSGSGRSVGRLAN